LLPNDVRMVLLHHMFGTLVAYRALHCDEKYDDVPLSNMLLLIQGDELLDLGGPPASHVEPKELINTILAAVRQADKSGDPTGVRDESNAFLGSLCDAIRKEAAESISRIERKLAILRPMKQTVEAAMPPELKGLMGSGGIEFLGGAAIPIGAGGGAIGDIVKQLLGGAGLGGEEDEEEEDDEEGGVDELMARERITAAVTEEFDGNDERAGLWSIHPARLSVTTPEGNVPLLQGVMDEQLTKDDIRQVIQQGRVSYSERVPSPA
jgi:hypothetical protein